MANLTREEAADRAALIASADYDVALDFTGGSDSFRSVSVIRFASVPGAATFVDVVGDVAHAMLNDVELFAPTGGRLALPGLAAENVLVVEATHAYSTAGVGIHRFVDPENGETFLYSQFATMYACHAFACFDQPDIKGTFAFTVTAPSHWVVVSNSVAPVADGGSTSDGPLTWAFERTVPLPTYATAVCAGPYAFVEGSITSVKGEIPARVYGRPQLLEHFAAERIFADTQAGFELYERIFDTEFPYDSYDHVYAPQYNFGAMENAGCVTVSEDRLLFRTRASDAQVEFRTVVIMHELAHMWFGDLVTMRWWDDLWLNESFAEYVGTYAAAVATEWSDAWVTFAAERKSIAYATDQLPTTHPVLSDLPDVDSVAGAFDMITYAKGASALKQLAATLGEDVFFAGVAAYLKAHAFANATLGDLFTELEAASGRSLTAWRTAWLETPGVTTLAADVTTDSTGRITSLAVTEEAPERWPLPRPHTLAVAGLSMADGVLASSFEVAVETDGPSTDVDRLVAEPRPEVILPNGGDLTYAKLHLDAVSLAAAREHAADIADPMSQALVLDALWHMCRDGVLPARDYVEPVLAALPGITVSAVRESHIRTIVTTVARYAAPDDAQARGADAAEALWAALEGAAPGSDAQLQFLKGYAMLARTEPQADRIEALLGDVLHLDGLPIDTELAWDLVTGLAACGRADDAAISEVLTKDATAAGERRAAGARAAIAALDAKQRAWNLLAHPQTKPLANALAYEAALGFARATDATFMAPLGETFFKEVRGLFDGVDVYVGLRVVQYAYPSFLVGRGVDIVGLGERWLADNGDAHPVLTKLMVEGLDHARRAARAQDSATRL
ncbi:aminopeptidase N [Demequina sp.]|uniref:aminopeptidase N n=1 Tax=Demequina sp. TaxID=2050685 RepID=UPI003D11E4F9